MKKTQAQKIAFCSVMAALCIAVMFLTGIVPVATLALPALAGCLLIAVVVEIGTRWAFGVYAVCAVLSLVVVPDKEAALYYILFFGYYPVLYAYLGRIKRAALRWAAKLGVFNAAMLLCVYIATKVLLIPVEEIPFLGPYTLLVLLALLNAVFILYDKAMNGLIVRYIRVIQPQVRKMFRSR